jgi:DinB superfamily
MFRCLQSNSLDTDLLPTVGVRRVPFLTPGDKSCVEQINLGPGVSAADISNIKHQYQMISERAEVVGRRLGSDLITARPRPGSWSAAECLMHLQITTKAYLPIWEEASRAANALGSDVDTPFRLDLWGRFFTWFLDPPPKLRFAAPGGFEPPTDRTSLAFALASFLGSQDEILTLINNARLLPLDRIAIRSAFRKYVRYSLWSSLWANAAHQRRHVWQAERAASALGR